MGHSWAPPSTAPQRPPKAAGDAVRTLPGQWRAPAPCTGQAECGGSRRETWASILHVQGWRHGDTQALQCGATERRGANTPQAGPEPQEAPGGRGLGGRPRVKAGPSRLPVATRKPLHHSGTGLDLGSRGSKLTHGLGGARMQAPSTAVPALRDQPCGCCPDAGTHTDFRTGCAGHRRPTAQNALALSLQGSGVGILQLSLLA